MSPPQWKAPKKPSAQDDLPSLEQVKLVQLLIFFSSYTSDPYRSNVVLSIVRLLLIGAMLRIYQAAIEIRFLSAKYMLISIYE